MTTIDDIDNFIYFISSVNQTNDSVNQNSLSILLEVDDYWYRYQNQINELSRSDSDLSNASTIVN